MQSAKKIAQNVADGHLMVDDIDQQMLNQHMCLADLPALDLLVRTGGETRISNFLLWQAAYAELYFSELLWPDFGPDALTTAIEDFYLRQRRFGLNGDQVEKQACATAIAASDSITNDSMVDNKTGKHSA